MIELRAVGTAEIRTPAGAIRPSQSIAFAAALYLILERRKPVSRKALSNLLWPDVSSPVRAHRLRQTLLQLRKLGLCLTATPDEVTLSGEDVRSDLDTINELDIARPSLEVLPGYTPEFSELFSEWLDSRRRELHARCTEALIRAISVGRQRGDWNSVEHLSSKCLELDAFNEVAVLAKAEAAAMRGAKHQAVGILDRFLQDVGAPRDLRLPAEILRRRIVERLPSQKRPRQITPFLGRETEFELLSQRVRAARGGNGGAVMITGAPGIGKTRLSFELGQMALLQGSHVQHMTCGAGDTLRPLSLFVDLVPPLRELPGALGCAPATLTALKRLTDFERLDDASRPTDSQALFGTVRAALFDLLEAVADEKSIIVLVDNVQLLDIQSAKLLAQMSEWSISKRALFILTARPEPNSVISLLDHTNLSAIPLLPLRHAASSSLLSALCDPTGRRMDSEFAAWCLSVAGGNPLFLQELVQQWIETGHEYEVPESIFKILDGRVSRLSGDALHVLQTTALLGEHATLERVQGILGLNTHQFVSAIEELNASAMLRTTTDALDSNPLRLQATHELVAASATDRLSKLSLALLHRRAAEALEREIGRDTQQSGLLWACASHRLRAGDKERALGHTMSCAEHLLGMGLARESSDAFEKSLQNCCNDDQRLRVLPRLAISLQAEAKWEQSKEILQKCISLHAALHPSAIKHNEFEILLLEARYNSSFDYVELLDDLTPCVECSEAPASHRVRAGIQALKLATDIGPRERLAAMYQHLEPLLSSHDVRRQDALELQLVYRTLAQNAPITLQDYREFINAGNPETVECFRRLITAVSSCRLLGRYEHGLAFANEAITCASACNLSNYVAQALLSEVQLHVAGAAYATADEVLQTMFANLSETQNPRLREEPYYMEARIAFELGDAERCGRALLKMGTATPSYSPSRRTYLYALNVALMLLQNESCQALLPHVLRLREAHEQSKSLILHDFEAYILYRGLCATGQENDAVSLLRDYVVVHRRSAWPLSDRLRKAFEWTFGAERLPNDAILPELSDVRIA